MADIPALLALINSVAGRGLLLPRTEFEMAENIRDFSVVHLRERHLPAAARCIFTPHAPPRSARSPSHLNFKAVVEAGC